jgi:ribosomal protein S18 acetylase RimI-like enzyme
MEVREVRGAELEAVGDLVVAAYVADGFVAPTSSYVARLRDTATRASEAVVLVAVDDGAVLGSVTWCPDGSSWREVAGPDEGEFRMLAVSPGARGRGVGEALVLACLDRARAEGRMGVAISSMPEMVGARRLYERLGFTRVPDLDWRPPTDHDDVLLEVLRLPLSP